MLAEIQVDFSIIWLLICLNWFWVLKCIFELIRVLFELEIWLFYLSHFSQNLSFFTIIWGPISNILIRHSDTTHFASISEVGVCLGLSWLGKDWVGLNSNGMGAIIQHFEPAFLINSLTWPQVNLNLTLK